MASVTGTFVPTYQGLSALDFVRRARTATRPFPFNVPDRLSFYRARNAIYHLFRALLAQNPQLTVLAPDYNSGNEILAIRAAGAAIHYCPVGPDMRMDPDVVERFCAVHNPDLLYVIHYAGWPQPMPALVDICRRRDMLLVEDCALSLLSEGDGRPLGSFGDWAVFCLYKTLPLPNGALLVQNTTPIESLKRLKLRDAGTASVIARTTELFVQRIRGRANGLGAALQAAKRGMGRAAGALDVQRTNVGDIGFNLGEVDIAMSGICDRLIDRMDFAAIVGRRVENYRLLADMLAGDAIPVFPALPDGVCPLFFPLLVADKHEAAEALRRRGVDALEFWNDSSDSGAEMGPAARYLRKHVLELPIHQDLSARHIAHIAKQVALTRPSGVLDSPGVAA
jgi:dTDP-4-amino-4,6-dideoxygalactose transaminase